MHCRVLEGLGGLGGAAQAGGAGNLAGLAGGGFGSVARQDVGTTIRITPHINENEEVRLEIEEEISEQGATSGTLGVVSINRRTARTETMVRDQQTIVIGGLMRDTVNNSEEQGSRARGHSNPWRAVSSHQQNKAKDKSSAYSDPLHHPGSYRSQSNFRA